MPVGSVVSRSCCQLARGRGGPRRHPGEDGRQPDPPPAATTSSVSSSTTSIPGSSSLPSEFRGHDYAGMLDRVVADLPITGGRRHPGRVTPRTVAVRPGRGGGAATPGPHRRPDDRSLREPRVGPKVFCTRITRCALIGRSRDNWASAPADRFLVPSPSPCRRFPHLRLRSVRCCWAPPRC